MHNKTWNEHIYFFYGSNSQQRINNNRTTAFEWTEATGGEGLKWIFALDSVDVKAQKLLSTHGGFLTIAMYP